MKKSILLHSLTFINQRQRIWNADHMKAAITEITLEPSRSSERSAYSCLCGNLD